MAQLMGNEGLIVGHDITSERLRLLAENRARLGVNCVQTTTDLESITTPHSTLRTPHSALRTPHFDGVLVDAPCSNTGVMRRRVDLRWRVTPQEIVRLSRTQLDLLQRAATAVKPGGILVYSTCSLEPEENNQVIESFLGKRPEFKMERERALMPFADGVDGTYVARLRRSVNQLDQ
jgi:16S rRNA (cytosine967-C5)-methyltransferase